MPRTGRGGSRSGMGTPGRTYPNRSDVLAPPPNQAAPGQEYGTAGQQAESMRQIPIAAPPTGPPSGLALAPSSAPSPALTQGPAAGPTGLTSLAQPPAPTPPGAAMPGELPWTNTPTQRPNEPITAGLPTGPGAGPEALVNGWGTGQSDVAQQSVGSLITALANQPGASSTLRGLAQLAQANKAG
jgi:hypothetical protein